MLHQIPGSKKDDQKAAQHIYNTKFQLSCQLVFVNSLNFLRVVQFLVVQFIQHPILQFPDPHAIV